MISFFLAGAIAMTALQASIDIPRKNFSACLSSALTAATTQKVPVADYRAFVATTCEAQAGILRNGLIGFDVKNGIKRTQATADAQVQIDDYFAMSAEGYEARAARVKPSPAAAPAPAAALVPPTTPKQ